MSGHSKWHNIQKKKGAADAKRGQLFTKLAKAITVAAKTGGGGDPDFNFQLRVAIDTAKSANMPKGNIDKAIKRGTGEGGEAGAIEEVVYEGFGPGGAALLIQCLTDNRNRSIADVRAVMNKNGGRLGEKGSVMWMFEKNGFVVLPLPKGVKPRGGHAPLRGELEGVASDEEFELTLIEAGAQDIREQDKMLEIVTSQSDLKKVLDALEPLGLSPEHAGLEYMAKDPIEIAGSDQNKLEKLVDALEDLDDVDVVSTNEK